MNTTQPSQTTPRYEMVTLRGKQVLAANHGRGWELWTSDASLLLVPMEEQLAATAHLDQ